ncbi:hypothetical protein JCM11641_001088 [Rhodosporidiobolus odoratus]
MFTTPDQHSYYTADGGRPIFSGPDPRRLSHINTPRNFYNNPFMDPSRQQSMFTTPDQHTYHTGGRGRPIFSGLDHQHLGPARPIMYEPSTAGKKEEVEDEKALAKAHPSLSARMAARYGTTPKKFRAGLSFE